MSVVKLQIYLSSNLLQAYLLENLKTKEGSVKYYLHLSFVSGEITDLLKFKSIVCIFARDFLQNIDQVKLLHILYIYNTFINHAL